MPNPTWNGCCDCHGTPMDAFAIPSEEWEQVCRPGEFALCRPTVVARLGHAPTLITKPPGVIWRPRELISRPGHPQLFGAA